MVIRTTQPTLQKGVLQEDTNQQVIERLDKLVKLLTKGAPPYSELQSTLGVPLYTVRQFPLDSARTDEIIDISGDQIAFWTNGTLIGCTIRLDSGTADAIPVDKFNPITYPKGWKHFFLTTTAQIGKTLWVFIGRAAGATTYPEITTSAERETFYLTRSDKDLNFTEALGQYAKENENLTGLITNKIRINGVTLLSDQQLKYKVLFWSKDTFGSTDLDSDTFVGEVDVDLTVYGWQVDGSGTYYMDVRNLLIDYLDDDSTNELHVSLMNMGGTGKSAGASGEVVIQVTYAPRT